MKRLVIISLLVVVVGHAFADTRDTLLLVGYGSKAVLASIVLFSLGYDSIYGRYPDRETQLEEAVRLYYQSRDPLVIPSILAGATSTVMLTGIGTESTKIAIPMRLVSFVVDTLLAVGTLAGGIYYLVTPGADILTGAVLCGASVTFGLYAFLDCIPFSFENKTAFIDIWPF